MSLSSFLNKVNYEGQNKWILETTHPLKAAMLGVASGRGSRLKMIII